MDFSERWFLRNKLNLQAEVLSQLENAAKGHSADYIEGEATRVDRLHLISERMRLLFVGITRARMELLLSSNHRQNRNPPRRWRSSRWKIFDIQE